MLVAQQQNARIYSDHQSSPGKTPKELLVEPGVFHTPTVDHAVDHRRQTFHLGLPAGRAARMKNDRPRLLLQCPIDIPDQLSEPLQVGLARLSVEQILEPAIAISGKVTVRFATTQRYRGLRRAPRHAAALPYRQTTATIRIHNDESRCRGVFAAAEAFIDAALIVVSPNDRLATG
jgi:hypothetical protein